MPTIKNPTPEQQAMIDEGRRYMEEYEEMERRGELVPAPRSLEDKIADQVETTAALLPGTKAREVYDEVMGKTRNPKGRRERPDA